MTKADRETPQRGALAEAIKFRDAAAAEVANCKRAEDRCCEMRLAAYQEVDDAKAAIEKAKAEAPKAIVDAFISGDLALALNPPSASAHQTRVAAEERIARLLAATEIIKQRRRDAEAALGHAEARVEDAIREVVRADPRTLKLVAECQSAMRTVRDLENALSLISNHLPESARFWRSGAEGEIPTRGKWEAAVKGLRDDAYVPLPD